MIDNRPELGGLARTCTHEGFRFDLGPHLLSRSAAGATYSFLEALLGGDLVQVPVRTACVLNGKLWDAQTLDMALEDLPFYRRTRIRGRYEVQRIKSRLFERELSNPRELCIALFGREAYVLLVKPYYDKLWGKHGVAGQVSESVRTSWIQRGLANPITGAFDLLDSSSILTRPAGSESYPRLGIGDVAARLVHQASSKTEFFTETEIETLEWSGDEITAVTVRRQGSRQRLAGSQFICTVAPEHLFSKMTPAPPESSEKSAAVPLRRSMVYVTLMLNRPRASRYNWVHVIDPSLPYFRYSDSSGWGESRSPSGKTSVTFEFSCDVNDPLLKAPAADLAQMCFYSSREQLEVRRSSDLLNYVVRRVPDAFGTQYANETEQHEAGRAFLATVQNLHVINAGDTLGAGSVQTAISLGLHVAKRIANAPRSYDNALPGSVNRFELYA